MRLACGIAGIALILVGLFLAVAGGAGMFLADVDVDRSGKVVLGLTYGALGLLLAVAGWRLWRRGRSTN